jgi:hypothetical protein
MLRELRAKKVLISARRDQADLKTLFGAEATAEVLWFIDNTEVGRRLIKEENSDDSWDIESLDRSANEEEVRVDSGGVKKADEE